MNTARLLDLLYEMGPSFQFVQSSQSTRHGDTPVMVDVAKLDIALSRQDSYVGSEGEGGIGDRYREFGEWVKGGKPIEMPEMNFDWTGAPQVINGRHRFAWLKGSGVREMPVAVPPAQVERFQQEFGSGV